MAKSSDDRVQLLLRLDSQNAEWLDKESEASGRSKGWLINHALDMWRRRLQRDRERRAQLRREG